MVCPLLRNDLTQLGTLNIFAGEYQGRRVLTRTLAGLTLLSATCLRDCFGTIGRALRIIDSYVQLVDIAPVIAPLDGPFRIFLSITDPYLTHQPIGFLRPNAGN